MVDGTVRPLENSLKSSSSHSEATSSEAQSNAAEDVNIFDGSKINHDEDASGEVADKSTSQSKEKRYVYGMCCRKNFACIFNTFNCARRV